MKRIFTLLLLSSAWLSNAQNNFDPNDVLSVASEAVGWWTFEDNANLGKAEPGYGTDLVLSGAAFSQVSAPLASHAIHKSAVGQHLAWLHGLAANGTSAAKVNEYTIMFDLKVPGSLVSWNSLLDTNHSVNDDGSFFIKGNGGLGYSSLFPGYPLGTIVSETWYRVVLVISLDPANSANWASVYVNGVKNQGSGVTSTQAQPAIDTEMAFEATVNFLTDNPSDTEEGPIDIGQIAVWTRKLNLGEIQYLGSVTAPLATPIFSVADNTLKVYPNPVSSNATISFNLANASKNANIELIDMTGRVIENIYRGSLDQGEQTISWDLKSKYNAGTYLVKLSSENANQVYSILMK